MAQYVLDNTAAEAEQRFASLESCYDPVTIRQLEEIGVAPGWRCLEVGGGGGSIARWLADRTGPAGGVVVTDINPRWLDADRPSIEMRRHDIVADELEPGAFDLARERLVLQLLPERGQALERMIGAVKPGGWLLIEDFDRGWLPLTPSTPTCSCRAGAGHGSIEPSARLKLSREPPRTTCTTCQFARSGRTLSCDACGTCPQCQGSERRAELSGYAGSGRPARPPGAPSSEAPRAPTAPRSPRGAQLAPGRPPAPPSRPAPLTPATSTPYRC